MRSKESYTEMVNGIRSLKFSERTMAVKRLFDEYGFPIRGELGGELDISKRIHNNYKWGTSVE
jgi:hypothetical protein